MNNEKYFPKRRVCSRACGLFRISRHESGRGKRQKKNENEGNERSKWNKTIHDGQTTKEVMYCGEKDKGKE